MGGAIGVDREGGELEGEALASKEPPAPNILAVLVLSLFDKNREGLRRSITSPSLTEVSKI